MSMATDQCSVTVVVKWAWWWPLYIHGLATVCAITGGQPDWAKVQRVCQRAMRVHLVPAPPAA